MRFLINEIYTTVCLIEAPYFVFRWQGYFISRKDTDQFEKDLNKMESLYLLSSFDKVT